LKIGVDIEMSIEVDTEEGTEVLAMLKVLLAA
jgi:hypothetical protein